jgi:putative protease
MDIAKIYQNRKIEVLAPSGKLDHVAAALEAGADAIYIGLKGFSARPDAWGFELNSAIAAAELAHAAGKKLYVAVNAEFRSGAEKEILSTFEKLEKARVDSVIIGDFGLLNFYHQNNFHIPVHASTLLGTYNAESLRFLKDKYKVERVVVNTGLEIDEMAALYFECPDVELELICHGGVCFNDNRRCRLPHYLYQDEYCVGCKQLYQIYPSENEIGELVLQKEASQISEKPLNKVLGRRLIWAPEVDLSALVGFFIKLGIVSFKIEGRTRPQDYIVQSTCLYRQAVDQALASPQFLDENLNQYYYLTHIANLRSVQQ